MGSPITLTAADAGKGVLVAQQRTLAFFAKHLGWSIERRLGGGAPRPVILTAILRWRARRWPTHRHGLRRASPPLL